MRVLIVKTSSMGDVVHALPVVSDIARVYPDARIDWLVEESFADVPRLHPHVTRVLTVALRRWRKRPWSRAHWHELLAARGALRETRYHAVIDCQGLVKSAVLAWSARGPVTGLAASCAREPLAALWYARRIVVDPRRHAVERNRALAAAALEYRLDLPEDYGVRARALQLEPAGGVEGEATVLLVTNASRQTKLWPDEYWIALEDYFAALGWRSVLAWGSPAEYVATRARVAAMRDAHLLARSTIAQVAALARRATLVVGLDTGLTHLAAAVGTPAVGIFCDYDPGLVGLRGPRTASLGGVAQTPTVAQVIAAVERVLAPEEPR